jgi:hypothetical protein
MCMYMYLCACLTELTAAEACMLSLLLHFSDESVCDSSVNKVDKKLDYYRCRDLPQLCDQPRDWLFPCPEQNTNHLGPLGASLYPHPLYAYMMYGAEAYLYDIQQCFSPGGT